MLNIKELKQTSMILNWIPVEDLQELVHELWKKDRLDPEAKDIIELTKTTTRIPSNKVQRLIEEYMSFQKKNIYIGHPKEIDYLGELYPAIKMTDMYKDQNVVLPHEKSGNSFNSKEFLKDCSLVIADASAQATGLGIELGWADIYKIPILCIYKKGSRPAGSYKVITNDFMEYENQHDLIEKLNDYTKKAGL